MFLYKYINDTESSTTSIPVVETHYSILGPLLYLICTTDTPTSIVILSVAGTADTCKFHFKFYIAIYMLLINGTGYDMENVINFYIKI